jgi:hypothetical protein
MDWPGRHRRFFRGSHVVFRGTFCSSHTSDVEISSVERSRSNGSASAPRIPVVHSTESVGGTNGRWSHRGGRVVKRAAVRRPASLFIAGLWAVGCATMLELDGYDDAVTLLCQCPGFETIDDCIGRANKRLQFASDAERQNWLEEFKDKQCGVVCDRADECYESIPSCQEKRSGCECCSWNDGKLSCTGGTCTTCRTCSEVATTIGDGNVCVTGHALYGELRQCACAECSSECGDFCQGTGVLQANLSDLCSTCLSGACSASLTACTADKP